MDVRPIAHEDPFEEVEKRLAAFLREVFETKNLYQRVMLPFDFDSLASPQTVEPSRENLVAETKLRMLDGPWTVGGFVVPKDDWDVRKGRVLTCRVDTAKLYCSVCKATEAHNCTASVELAGNGLTGIKCRQVVAFAYACQNCKASHHVVVMERTGRKVALAGRSPIARVDCPRTIPENFSQHYRNGLLAFQSGQTLAALFLLRTFVEQFMRAVARSSARNGDDLAKDYSATLPERLRGEMQSLGDVYADLSAAMHEARADDVLFREALRKIDQHFEQRQAFRITASQLG